MYYPKVFLYKLMKLSSYKISLLKFLQIENNI